MFANIEEYESCGIFTKGRFILMAITLIGILIALKYSFKENKEEVIIISGKIWTFGANNDIISSR